MNKKITIVALLLSILLTSTFISYYTTDLQSDTYNKKRTPALKDEVTPEEAKSWDNFTFIHITGLNWTIAKNLGWVTGEGSCSNPFILENMTINATTSLTECGIIIENSKNYYFKIQNCTVFGATDKGIYILDSNNGTVFNNTVNDCLIGIYTKTSDNHTIYENQMELCTNGIKIENCNNTVAANNTIDDCLNGIFLTDYPSYQNLNITINNNNMTNCGLAIRGDYAQLKTDTIENNKANGKPIHYYFNKTNLYPIDFINSGQVLLYYCNDSIVSNVNISHTSHGIVLDHSYNLTVSYSNSSYNNNNGIFLHYGSNNTIINNTNINNNKYQGIQLAFTNNNSIINNTNINNNLVAGIQTILSGNNTISGNYLFNNTEYGIDAAVDSGNKILNNTIIDSQIGIDIMYSKDNIIRENDLINCGLYVAGDDRDDLSNIVDLSNTVNGKTLYYYDDENYLNEADFNNAGQIILINCNHSVGANLNVSYATQGITIYFCKNISLSYCNASDNFENGLHIVKSNNITLSNIEASYCEYGIYFYMISNCTIQDGNFSFNREDGLYLLVGNNFNISLCFFLNNSLSGAKLYDLTNSIIHNNTIRCNEEDGLIFESAEYNLISKNNIGYNGESGISVGYYHNNISENTIYNNLNGIKIDGASYCNVTLNTIKDNLQYGLTINFTYAKGNTIVNNTFINSGISHAFDEGTSNHWDNGVFGNFWDDYTAGQDINDDGISESGVPYNIPGGSSQDHYPLFWDAPVISFTSPNNDTLYGLEPPYVLASIIEGVYDWFWYTFNTDPTKYNFTQPREYLNDTAWGNLGNGTITVHFFANDSRGYIATVDLIVRRDCLDPSITIKIPTIKQQCGSTAPDFEIEIVEPHLHKIWYRLYNGTEYTDNYSCSYTGTINQTAWDIMWKYIPEGNNITIIFYANDTRSNLGFEIVNVTKYISVPSSPSGDGGDDDSGNGGDEDSDLVGFLLSPTGLVIIGASGGGAVATTIFFLKRRGTYKSSAKEIKRIENIRKEDGA